MSSPATTNATTRAGSAALWCLHAIVIAVPLAATNFTWLGVGSAALTTDTFALAKWALLGGIAFIGLTAWAWDAVTTGRGVRFHWALWVVLALLAWAGVTTVLGVNWRSSILGEYAFYDGVSSLAFYAATLFLTMQLIDRPSRIASLGRSVVVGGLLVAAYGLVQYTGHDPAKWGTFAYGNWRIFSTYGNPDPLAAYLVFPFAIAPVLALSEAKRTLVRVAYWLASVVMLVTLVVIRVRGAWIAAVVVIALLVVAAWRTRAKTGPTDWLTLGGSIAVALGLFFLAPGVGRRASAIAGAAGSVVTRGVEQGSNGRFAIWRTLAVASMHRPIFGWGPDNTAAAFSRYRTVGFVAAWGDQLYVSSAHNYLLQYLTTMGIPGLVLACGLWGCVVFVGARTLLARGRDGRGLVAWGWWIATVGLSVALFTSVANPGSVVFLWIGSGVLLSLSARSVEVRARTMRSVATLLTVLAVLVTLWVGSVVGADALATRTATSAPVAAAGLLERAVRLNPLSLSYRVDLGNQYLQMAAVAAMGGDTKTAYTYAMDADGVLQKTVHIAPYDERAWDRWVTLRSTALDWSVGESPETVVQAAKAMLDRVPSDPAAMLALAQGYVATKQYPLAESTLRTLVIAAPKSADAVGLLGYVLEQQGRKAEAAEKYRTALVLSPGNQSAQQGLDRVTGTDGKSP